MIVTCPSCGSRYRLPEDKITDRGARVNCPKCSHRFVVQRPGAKAVIGEAKPRGLAVTIAKEGKLQRAPTPIEDEDDAPTTLMPGHHSLVAELRASFAAEAAAAKEEAAAQDEAPAPEATPEPPPAETPAPTPAPANPPAPTFGTAPSQGSSWASVLTAILILVGLLVILSLLFN